MQRSNVKNICDWQIIRWSCIWILQGQGKLPKACLYVNATFFEFLLSSRAVNVKHYFDQSWEVTEHQSNEIFNWLLSVMMTRLIRINLRVSAEFVCIVIEQPFAKKQEWWWRSWWLKRICGVGAAQTKFPKLSGCLFHKQTLPAMQNIRLKRK